VISGVAGTKRTKFGFTKDVEASSPLLTRPLVMRYFNSLWNLFVFYAHSVHKQDFNYNITIGGAFTNTLRCTALG